MVKSGIRLSQCEPRLNVLSPRLNIHTTLNQCNFCIFCVEVKVTVRVSFVLGLGRAEGS